MGLCTSSPEQKQQSQGKSEADLDRERWAAEREWKNNPKPITEGKLTIKPTLGHHCGTTRLSIARPDPNLDEVEALVRTVVRRAISNGIGAFVVIKYPLSVSKQPIGSNSKMMGKEDEALVASFVNKILITSILQSDPDAPIRQEQVGVQLSGIEEKHEEINDDQTKVREEEKHDEKNEEVVVTDDNQTSPETSLPVTPAVACIDNNIQDEEKKEGKEEEKEQPDGPHVINLINASLLELPQALITTEKYITQYRGLFVNKTRHLIGSVIAEEEGFKSQVEELSKQSDKFAAVNKGLLCVVQITPSSKSSQPSDLKENITTLKSLLNKAFKGVIIISRCDDGVTRYDHDVALWNKFIQDGLKRGIPMFRHTAMYSADLNNATSPTDTMTIKSFFKKVIGQLESDGTFIQELQDSLLSSSTQQE